MNQAQILFEELVHLTPDATLGQLFGKPCGKLNKKAFVAFYQNHVVFKVGREHILELIQTYEGSKNWDPSGKGRPMKDWLQVPEDFSEKWGELTSMAVEFCAGQ